jgi:hypothetical protein
MININMFIDIVGIVNARQSPLLNRQAFTEALKVLKHHSI